MSRHEYRRRADDVGRQVLDVDQSHFAILGYP